MNIKQIIQDAKDLRSNAIREARRQCPFVRSRGVDFVYLDEDGNFINSAVGIPLTQSYILDLIRRNAFEGKYFALTGGVDGAVTFEGLDDGDYEPWIACWDTDDFTAADVGL